MSHHPTNYRFLGILYDNNKEQILKDLGVKQFSLESYEELREKFEEIQEKHTKRGVNNIFDLSGVFSYMCDAAYMEAVGILECNPLFLDAIEKDIKDIETLSKEEQLIVKYEMEKQALNVGVELDIDSSKIQRYEYTLWC